MHNPWWSQNIFIRKIKKIYLDIEENTAESNFEFLSEADMESMGWNEKLWVISQHFGPPKVLVTQMYLLLATISAPP